MGLEHARAEAARVERLAQAQAVARQASETAGYEVLAREKELALAERAVERSPCELEAARAVLPERPARAAASGSRCALLGRRGPARAQGQ